MPNLKLHPAPKRPATLKQVLALKNPPAGGLGWHERIEAGLPAASLYTVAKAIRVTDKYLANFLGVDLDALQNDGALGRIESDLLFAVARAYTRAATKMGVVRAGVWLATEQEALGGRAPIDALRTRIGTEYVSGLINQLGVARNHGDGGVATDEKPSGSASTALPARSHFGRG
jgi:uncharacterized protein (DUF2384 family)